MLGPTRWLRRGPPPRPAGRLPGRACRPSASRTSRGRSEAGPGEGTSTRLRSGSTPGGSGSVVPIDDQRPGQVGALGVQGPAGKQQRHVPDERERHDRDPPRRRPAAGRATGTSGRPDQAGGRDAGRGSRTGRRSGVYSEASTSSWARTTPTIAYSATIARRQAIARRGIERRRTARYADPGGQRRRSATRPTSAPPPGRRTEGRRRRRRG